METTFALQWTTGSASNGIAGYGGVPATAGVNSGDGVNFFQIGRFNQSGTSFDGSYGNIDGVDYLDQQAICFKAAASVKPPVAVNVPAGRRLDLACDESLADYQIIFLAPENNQTVTLTSSGESAGLTVTTSQQTNQATATLNWTPTTAAEGKVTFTASDGVDSTVVPVTYAYHGSCCTAGSAEIWNPITGSIVGPLVNGTLRAIPCEPAPLVDMKLSNMGPGGVTRHRQKECEAPYFLFGDVDGDIFPNKKKLVNGLYGFRCATNATTTEITFTQACP